MRSNAAVSILSFVAFAALTPQPSTGQLVPQGAAGFDEPVVSVAGSGEAFVAPTRAVLFVQIVAEEESPEVAALRNGEVRARVMEALRALGYEEREAGLWGYGAGPSAARGYGGPATPTTVASYTAKSGLRVVVEPVERLDAVASSLLMAGASVSTVELESDEAEAARSGAARNAVTQARAQAEAMAEAAGGRLGDLLSLTTVPDYAMGAASRMQWSVYSGGPGAEATFLTPSDLIIIVNVQATWAFVRR